MTRLAAALVCAAAATAGCATEPALPDRAGPAPTPAKILEVFARDHDGWKTISANVTGDSEKGSFSGKVFIDRDARRLRLYAWKLGGAMTVFDLLVEGDEVRLLVPRTRRLLVTTASKLPLATYFQTFFRPKEPVKRELPVDRRYKFPDPSGVWIFEPGAGDGRTAYVLHVPSLALETQFVRRMVISYRDPIVTADGRVWPATLEVEKPEFFLHFENIVFDAPLDARKFEMRLPPDTVRVATPTELDRE